MLLDIINGRYNLHIIKWPLSGQTGLLFCTARIVHIEWHVYTGVKIAIPDMTEIKNRKT